jgi:hypothetical protein
MSLQQVKELEGVLLVDKPQGLTSHDVVYRLRRKLQMKKIGHAGTLDPMATGVLVMLIGKATRISQYLMSTDKIYEGEATLGQELQLVRAYLELMHLRMPDRLQFSIEADDAARDLRCPPTTLLTLVENAVRHGIDPGEEGGRIDVRVTVRDGRCIAQAIMLGGTVSAEHGIGKLKRKYLAAMMGERYLNEMAELKRAFDPNGILGRGNMFDETYI